MRIVKHNGRMCFELFLSLPAETLFVQEGFIENDSEVSMVALMKDTYISRDIGYDYHRVFLPVPEKYLAKGIMGSSIEELPEGDDDDDS